MKLQLFDSTATRSLIADWVELSVLTQHRGFSAADLARSRTIVSEPNNGVDVEAESGEEVEREILDGPEEQFADDIWTELLFRQTVLGSAYPFKLTRRHASWRLELNAPPTQADKTAHVLYLSCLIMTGMRRGIISKDVPDDEKFAKLLRRAADVLQAASYVAASELVGGKSHWFGWPRPDGTTKMRAALDKLVDRVGHGKLKQRDPAWSSGYEKDGTIDVVVWRPFEDRRHGGILILGQVASGLNWIDKSPRTFVDSHFNDWFEEHLEHQFLTAMFIPFMLHEHVTGNSNYSFDEVAAASIRQLSIVHGTLVDRVRLVSLVRDRLEPGLDEEILPLGARLYRWYAGARAQLS